MRLFPCGCVLGEGEAHYCGRSRVVRLPMGICPHDVQDYQRAACARCGLTDQQRLGALPQQEEAA